MSNYSVAELRRKKTTDCVTKSKFFRSIKKKHTGNFAGYVTNRKHSGK